MAVEDGPTIKTASAGNLGWVLVLVREQRLRQLLLVVLGRASYTLIGCATLEDAGKIMAQRSAPRLILFDGAEASEALLQAQISQIEGALAPGANCRLIVFSLAHPQPRLRALPGVNALIARPFDLTDVLESVDALMRVP